MRKLSAIALVSCLSLGVTAAMAQTTPSTSMDKPATSGSMTSGSMSKTTTTTSKSKMHTMSAKGAITAMDATAKSITVGDHTYMMTDTTKVMAHGKKMMMSDLKVGDMVSVSYTKDGDTMNATRVTVTKSGKM